MHSKALGHIRLIIRIDGILNGKKPDVWKDLDFDKETVETMSPDGTPAIDLEASNVMPPLPSSEHLLSIECSLSWAYTQSSVTNQARPTFRAATFCESRPNIIE